MKVIHHNDVELHEVKIEGAKSAQIGRVLAKNDGAPNFSMRIFKLEEGGHTPFHAHEWEHEIFAVAGEGEIVTENDGIIKLVEGTAALINSNEKHQFRNTTTEPFKFLCLVPNAYD